MKKITLNLTLVLLAALIAVGGLAGCGAPDGVSADSLPPLPKQDRLRVATTTSLYDTGLWGYLEPMFEAQYGIEVDVVYAGTGIAIEYGKRGDVDVITVHSKSRETAFVKEGYGLARVPFAYNYFLIVGPETDPAGIRGMAPEDAFKKLYNGGRGDFISRGDDSGTHGKEKSIWSAAGYEYADVQKAGEWYVEAGRGMGPTLLMANEKQAYTLTDVGTFLSYSGDLELVPIVDQGSMLLNVYSVIAGNPEANPEINAGMARNMVAFLTSAEAQQVIGKYGLAQYGMRLFTPCAGNEPMG